MTHLLFSYGTLQLPRVQLIVFGREVEGEADAITGHELVELRITDQAVIAASGTDQHTILVPADDPAARVTGTALTLDDEQLAAADAYEVDAYVRVAHDLESGRTAWVYVLDQPGK